MNSNDYVKYLTEQFVQYMNQPRTERQSLRQEKKGARPPVRYHLFGMIPYAFSHYIKKFKRAKPKHRRM
ncbi:hypothetical protein GCM10011391_26910 [Pullulanibacillus camelliae]|uniref:YqzE family protein n=1 Tax=Pullulanibacillus camelliae TaxID=1707096 RepID=A0A8J2YJ01_9BACL|nr:YqzE family protein [Pullulanibacillus camelliae]GGE46685.1 hypothetical protein GCM10011391_26910 [Pullulanibacillus camelliae]